VQVAPDEAGLVPQLLHFLYNVLVNRFDGGFLLQGLLRGALRDALVADVHVARQFVVLVFLLEDHLLQLL